MTMNTKMKLALGTAQFGLDYGVAGRGKPVPENEVRQILVKAWEFGIRVLDTAPVYGNIEEQLTTLMGDLPFSIVSKIPVLPPEIDKKELKAFINMSVHRSISRLKTSLDTLLFHRSTDLLGVHADIIWQTALDALEGTGIRLGASCYSPEELELLSVRFNIEVSQIPGNAFDQRLLLYDKLDHIDVFLRSVFLQGVLLLEQDKIMTQLPKLYPAFKQWQSWCKEQDVSPLTGALSIVKQFSGARYCVIGVDNIAQLESIVEAWSNTQPMHAPTLASDNLDVIDPRRWFL